MIKSWVACTPRAASSSVSKLVLKSRRIATINGHSKHTGNIGCATNSNVRSVSMYASRESPSAAAYAIVQRASISLAASSEAVFTIEEASGIQLLLRAQNGRVHCSEIESDDCTCAHLKRLAIAAKPSGVKLNPPFRAEHIGSLLRPRELKDAFGARIRGSLAEPQFREIQERCIVDAIRLQEQAGLETITDGEFRRVAWSTGFVSALDGLESRQSTFEFRDAAGNSQRWDTCYASGRLGRSRAITIEEFHFVGRHTRRTPNGTMAGQ